MSPDADQRRARGEIETLPSGSLRVRVYAGADPGTRKRRYLTETVPAGDDALRTAEEIRDRLVREAARNRIARRAATRSPQRGASADPGAATPPGADPDTPPRGRKSAELTVAAIARLAGVSPPTVSKVLNGRAGVSPDTRRRVEDLLRGQGYRRPEKVTRAACVEVVFYSVLGALAVEIMRGVKQVVVEHAMAVGFTDVLREASTGRNWARDLLARRPTGIIGVHMGAMPEQHGLFDAGALPLVVIDPTSEPMVPSVSAANHRGAFAAAKHLIDLGHRRIAVITGPLERLCSRARLDGARSALTMAGLPIEEQLIRRGLWFSFEDGVVHGGQLLRLADRPTAILCGNDLQAFGVYEAARQAGVRIPQDLSVVGFDDISHAGWCGPPLTTVQQPLIEMGATAAKLVLALAANETITQTRIELAAPLIVRGSTAAPPR